MNDKSALPNNSPVWLVTCGVALVLTVLKVADAQSAPKFPPAAAGTKGHAPSERLIVIDKPIFAPPKGGDLLLATGKNNADRTVLITEVKQFRVAFPPGVKDGQFSILRLAKTVDENPGGLKPQHWYKIHSLGTKKAKFTVDWNPAANSAIATPKPIRAADISIDILTEKITINAGSALLAGGRGIGRGRIPLEQMVLDFRLKNGTKERIQFLPTPPQNKIVFLGPSTPPSITTHVPPELVATDTKPHLSLALESFQMRGRRRIHLVGSDKSANRRIKAVFGQAIYVDIAPHADKSANRRIKAVWINLTSGPTPDGKPAAGTLSCLIFRLVHGKLLSNYGREVRLIPSITARLNAKLQLILKQKNQGAADFPPGFSGGYDLGYGLERVKATLAIVAARDKRLRCLRLLSLGVELYPGGPVLETVTYEKPGIATQPAGRRLAPARPARKKRLSPGF